MASNTNPHPRLYFAYGSNLSLTQMSLRCPTSTYHSLGLLHNYTWVISPRGYANIIYTPASPSPSSSQPGAQEGGGRVYGLLYTLQAADEALLDLSEGVPDSYTKHFLDVEIVRPSTSTSGTGSEKEVVQALVYIDEVRKSEGSCKEEYVARMNRGIRDAVQRGMPASFVENVLRKWVREGEVREEVWDPFLVGGEEGLR